MLQNFLDFFRLFFLFNIAKFLQFFSYLFTFYLIIQLFMMWSWSDPWLNFSFT